MNRQILQLHSGFHFSVIARTLRNMQHSFPFSIKSNVHLESYIALHYWLPRYGSIHACERDAKRLIYLL